MSRIKVCLMSLTTLALLASCASRDTVNAVDVNEETFFRNFYVQYEEETKALAIYIEARVGGDSGTTVRLDPDKAPSFNGQEMQVCDGKDADCPDAGHFRFDSGTYYYSKTKVDSFQENYVVTWTKKSGELEQIFLPMAAPLCHHTKIKQAWAGSPNRERETVYLLTRAAKAFGVYFSSTPQKPGKAFDLKVLFSDNTPKPDEETSNPELATLLERSYSFVRELQVVPQSKNGPIFGRVSSTYQSGWKRVDEGNE